MSRVIVWGASWLGLFGMWLLMVGNVSLGEAIAGACAASLCLGFIIALDKCGGFHFPLKARWLIQGLSLVPRILRDCWVVFAALGRYTTGRERSLGRFYAVPYPFEPSEDLLGSQLALTTIGTTLTPNVFVVGVDPEKRQLLVHALCPPEGAIVSQLWWPR